MRSFLKNILQGSGLCCLLIVLESCTFIPDDGQPGGVFYAMNFKTNEPYRIETVKLFENERCIIYKSTDSAGTVAQGAAAIGAKFQDKIYPSITDVFGEPLDIDGNGKVILILMDIIDGLTDSYVAGYFFSADMYSKTDISYSNEGEILYIDDNDVTPGSESFYATMAHEFQHLLRFSDYARRKNNGEDISETEVWLNEGLSTAAEYIYLDSHINEYISHFNSDPNRTIRNGNNFYFWDDNNYDDYATAYLFFQWLRTQAETGADKYTIYRKICESGKSGYEGVLAAAQELFSDSGEIKAWEDLIGSWFLANYINAGSGLYGYHGELSLTVRPYSGAGRRIPLYPGEGVYSSINTTFSPETGSGPHISYLGADKDGMVNKAAPFMQDMLLTFNINNDINAEPEDGQVTGVRTREQTFRSVGTAPVSKFRVDGSPLLPPVPDIPPLVLPAERTGPDL
jgi:hypothetical protein